MRRYVFIVNPVAGKGKGLNILSKIKDKFKGEDYAIWFTEWAGHGEELARKAGEEGFTHIVAVGGDGTAFEVLNGIKDNNVVLGIIPTGTGNDFARMISLPKDTERVLDVIHKGRTKAIDIGKINDKYFLNVASVGIDAEIVKATEETKRYASGTAAYILGVFKTLFKFKGKKIKLSIDGKEFHREVELVAVGNGGFYGGGMNIIPFAKVDDGIFHICLVKKINKLKMAFLFPLVFKGNHVKITKYVEFFEGKEINITCDEEMLLNADGNLVGMTPMKITMCKACQEVIVP